MLAGGIARLSGAVDPLGVPTTYQFQYGTATGRYDTLAPTVPAALGAGTAAVAVSVEIRVSPGTTYHYRLTATKAGRAISTAGATFTTPR
jgi:hypothetical protein